MLEDAAGIDVDQGRLVIVYGFLSGSLRLSIADLAMSFGAGKVDM